MLPNYWWSYPFLIHKPTKILRPESSGNHVITQKAEDYGLQIYESGSFKIAKKQRSATHSKM